MLCLEPPQFVTEPGRVPDGTGGPGSGRRCARNQVSSAIEDRDFSYVLDLHERLGRDAAPDAVIAQR